MCATVVRDSLRDPLSADSSIDASVVTTKWYDPGAYENATGVVGAFELGTGVERTVGRGASAGRDGADDVQAPSSTTEPPAKRAARRVRREGRPKESD